MNEKKLKQINGNAAQQAKVLQHDVKIIDLFHSSPLVM
jgi:hypothetical protein